MEHNEEWIDHKDYSNLSKKKHVSIHGMGLVRCTYCNKTIIVNIFHNIIDSHRDDFKFLLKKNWVIKGLEEGFNQQ